MKQVIQKLPSKPENVFGRVCNAGHVLNLLFCRMVGNVPAGLHGVLPTGNGFAVIADLSYIPSEVALDMWWCCSKGCC